MTKLMKTLAILFTACISANAAASTTTIEKAQLVEPSSITLNAQSYLMFNQIKLGDLSLPTRLTIKEVAFKQAKQVIQSEELILVSNNIVAD